MMNTQALEAVALSVRMLSIDAVQKAKSGHPGLPMGVAELGALLYGEILRYNPAAPSWINRDRFVLSAGHGSMLLYSLLHLSGFDLPLEELKSFRQIGSKTPGHPEYGHTDGVDTTTGPLGQGLANAVGMAIAERMLAAKFNTPTHAVIDHYTYAIAGDGCMMEGVASEASSLAGHLKLGKLIVFYDSNRITIEGSTELAFSEDVRKRFDAYGWHTQAGDGYDIEGIRRMVKAAQEETGRPSLIVLNTTIAKGSPNMAGSHEAHGAPLGEEEVRATKRALGVPEDEQFFIHPAAVEFFAGRKRELAKAYEAWIAMFDAWAAANPGLKTEWDFYMGDDGSAFTEVKLPEYKPGDKVATRVASGKALQSYAAVFPNLVGGSADLAPSNNTALPLYGDFMPDNPTGRTLHFGVREHAMGAVCNGLALHGGLRPFCATFLVFSDYMRPSMRLAALMKLPVVYIMTHDSIYLGEDGPTHQPVEHVAALRSIPNMLVLRPADALETNLAWTMALERTDGPTVLALTRQNLEVFERPDPNWTEQAAKGAYVALECSGKPDVVVAATGSEVNLAIAAAKKVTGKKVRVVSVFSRELFYEQDEAFRTSILGDGARVIVTEAARRFGWEGLTSSSRDFLGVETFGVSGPGPKAGEYFGLTADNLAKLIES